MKVLVGDKDNLIRRLYVEPLQKVRPDWPVASINDANHITCIVKPQFRDEIDTWLRGCAEKGEGGNEKGEER
jgi:hypothetical protein